MEVIGHRGARGLAPENTLVSLSKALEHNVDSVEFDVRVTKDNVPILLHNRHLRDASGNRLNCRHHNFSELKQHKAGLATLEEVLAALPSDFNLYIEVKRGEKIKPITHEISKAIKNGRPEDTIALASKSYKTLCELQKVLPHLSLIVIEPWSGVRATSRARRLNTKRLSMNQFWLWPGFIKSVRRSGFELYAYTLNNPEKARRWHKHGLRGVVTDYPDRFEA